MTLVNGNGSGVPSPPRMFFARLTERLIDTHKAFSNDTAMKCLYPILVTSISCMASFELRGQNDCLSEPGAGLESAASAVVSEVPA